MRFSGFPKNVPTFSQLETHLPKEVASQGAFNASLQPQLELLLGMGRAAGADFVEFFLEKRHFLSALVENNKVTNITPSSSLGAGVRVFKGKEDSYVSTNDLSFQGLKSALNKALSIHNLQYSPFSFVPAVHLEMIRDYAQLKEKEIFTGLKDTVRQISSVLLLCNEQQKKKIKHSQNVTTTGFSDVQEILVAASDGIFARDIRFNSTIALQASCEDKGQRCSVSKRVGESGNYNFFTQLKTEKIAAELAESAGHMLHADYVQAGKYPIIMANQFGGVIFHEACGHLLETTSLQARSTPFAEKKGEKIAHENVTAWDVGDWQHGFGSIDIDDEGMPAQQTLLIENGILKNFIADRAGSLFTGQPRTGSGRRQNYGFAAASRMRNTFIAPGKFTKDDIFSSVEKGIYCKNLGGGSVNSTGQFNFAVEEAWLVENGHLVKPLKGATLIGEATEVLQNISMAADDLEIAAGFCGSVSGSVYVTVGQPHIKVETMTVGGR